MRIFLLPVSTRRTLLYCQRLEDAGASAGAKTGLVDKATVKAAKMWAEWEHKAPGTWQHRLVTYGNAGLRRIAFEEWGLKSVPPATMQERRAASETASETASKPVEVVYPPALLGDATSAARVLDRLSSERDALHRKRLTWCFIGMPISAPFGLVPVVPNIPFFYLAFRAWSHWRAIAGGKHIQDLLKHDALVFRPSPVLDAVYARGTSSLAASQTTDALVESTGADETLLLTHPASTKAVAEAFEVPALELELERAIWQIQSALAKKTKEAQQAQASAPPTAEQSEKGQDPEPPQEKKSP